jgi:predicted PurR-regulated permease PerM
VLFDVAIVIFALFFMLRDGPRMGAAIRQVIPLAAGHRDRLTREIQDLIHASVTSSMIVASAQGFLGGVLFLVLGVEGSLFWGVVMSFLSLFPLVGSWLVWAPAAAWLLLNDHLVKGVILIVGGVVMVGGIDNILRPILLGERAQMGMLHLLVALLGGVAAFGFIGLILGPVVMAVALSVFRAYTQEQAPPPSAD